MRLVPFRCGGIFPKHGARRALIQLKDANVIFLEDQLTNGRQRKGELRNVVGPDVVEIMLNACPIEGLGVEDYRPTGTEGLELYSERVHAWVMEQTGRKPSALNHPVRPKVTFCAWLALCPVGQGQDTRAVWNGGEGLRQFRQAGLNGEEVALDVPRAKHKK